MYDSERYQFIATQAVIVTYVDVPHHDYPLNRSTFQVVLTTDGNVTYGIFNYKWLNRSHAVTGFCEPLCFYMTFQSLHEFEPGLSYYLERRSNIGIQGQFVFILTSDPCQERGKWLLFTVPDRLFYSVVLILRQSTAQYSHRSRD